MEGSEIRVDLLTKEELIHKFTDTPANYIVFAAMLAISAVIGIFFCWRGQKNTEEFLMASRSMGTLPMTMSLIASFMSAITLLGTPAEMYVSGSVCSTVNILIIHQFILCRCPFLEFIFRHSIVSVQ